MSETASPPVAETPAAALAAAPAATSVLTSAPPAEAAKPTEGGEAKPAEGAKAEAPAVPEKYEFTAPEGVTVDAPLLERWNGIAKEAGLTQDQYGKMAPLAAGIVTELRAEAAKAWADTNKAWQTEINADPDIGGAGLGKMRAEDGIAASKAMEAFGGDALKQALVQTGAGNHPAVVKAFIQIGRALGEESKLNLGTGRANGGEPMTREQIAASWYPSMVRAQ